VRIVRVLSEFPANWNILPVYDNIVLKAGDEIKLCDHYNDDPQMLYAGKTYAAQLSYNTHNPANSSVGVEWHPQEMIVSTQYRPDGSPKGGRITAPAITEVTDGFYETHEGRLVLDYAAAVNTRFFTLPVLPTNGTNLLLPFYNLTAAIVEGEDITAEEYANGERVCLITEKFAEWNGISVGDTLNLPLFYADCEAAPNDEFYDFDVSDMEGMYHFMGVSNDSLLSASGEPYPVFSEHGYVVKGIYINTISPKSEFSMGMKTVIVPAASVRESDADNILAFGPMRDETTAFQIPNGEIESFTEKWLARDAGDLEITFHDRGYTVLRRGLENMKRVSALFLAIGAAMSLALVFFFCNVFISKNKLRTAVERMLGYTKRQCAASLLSGFLLAAAIAVAIGCGAGVYAEGAITKSVSSKEYYDTSYTIGPLGDGGAAIPESAASALYSPAAGLALLIVTCAVSGAFMRGNVSAEPLAALSGKGE
jgi:hypothetical protein